MPNPLHSTRYLTFRALLVKARLAAGLTQVQVAERLNKPQSYVSKYERGERRLDFAEFVELAEVLELDAAEFLTQYRAELSNTKFLGQPIPR